jgi:hypothetical protein
MDFSDVYKQSSQLVVFSPGTQFILTAVQDRLIVRRSDSFQIRRTWLVDGLPSQTYLALPRSKTSAQNATTIAATSSGSTSADNWISHIGWSSDSEYILAASVKKCVVHVFKLRDEEWTARIDSGAEGLMKAEWAPDGRHVLCFSEWGVR